MATADLLNMNNKRNADKQKALANIKVEVELGFDREASEVRRRLLEDHGDSRAADRLREVDPPDAS